MSYNYEDEMLDYLATNASDYFKLADYYSEGEWNYHGARARLREKILEEGGLGAAATGRDSESFFCNGAKAEKAFIDGDGLDYLSDALSLEVVADDDVLDAVRDGSYEKLDMLVREFLLDRVVDSFLDAVEDGELPSEEASDDENVVYASSNEA